MPMDNYNFRFDLTAEMPLLSDLWPENGLFVSSDEKISARSERVEYSEVP